MFNNGTSALRSAINSVMFALVAAAAIGTASAQVVAYTAKDVHVRAGPAVDYPVVAILSAGVEILVEGCLSDYQWCDVVAGPNRGWVYAGNIVYPYQGANVPVLNYGAMIGLGIITFSVGNYWDHYYRGRPWYSQRQVWIDRPRSAFGPGAHRPPMHGPVVAPGNQRQPLHAPIVMPGSRRPPPQQQAPSGGQRPAQGPAPGTGPHSPRAQDPSHSSRQQQVHRPDAR